VYQQRPTAGELLSPLLFLLSLEPMCNLLRQQSQHGLTIGSKCVTGAYFADDSTLFSKSISSLHHQLELVQTYCVASGAKLNYSKCVVLVLNRHGPLPELPNIRVLPDGESVKYLGVLFGRHDLSTEIIEQIDQRLYASLVLWSRRARTIEGRKLLASSVILSTMWHVALHVDINQAQIRRWQSSVNSFILRGYKQDGGSKLHLIPNRYLYLDRSEYGLQFPQIEAVLRQQRLNLVQQFVLRLSSVGSSFSWVTTGEYLFRCALGDYHGFRATDFLWIDPTGTRSELRLHYLPTWWQHTWRQWIRQRWPVQDLSWQYLLRAPLWLTSHQQLRFQPALRRDGSVATKKCLGMPTLYHRPFRRWYVQATKRTTLSDFIGPDGRWPSFDEFSSQVNRLLGSNVLSEWGNYVQLLPIQPKVKKLYQELTSVIQALLPDEDLENYTFPVLPRVPIPKCGVEVGDKTVWFPSVPTKHLRLITRFVPPERKAHPVVQFFDQVPNHVPDHEALDHLEFFVDCRPYMLPVIHDVMLRLLYRGLPVRYKFWFLQGTEPDIICCEVPECQAVETEQHLLHSCHRVRRIWSKLLPLWRTLFGCTIGWSEILLSSRIKTRSSHSTKGALHICWTVMCSIVLHHIWRTRNSWVFEQRKLPPVDASVKQILLTFASHFRYLDRLWRPNQEKRKELEVLKSHLLRIEPYASYYKDHPVLLKQRSPAVGRCWYTRATPLPS
jgi:Reverse transcriptase (RNA-dependent DNA polymerase)